MLLLTVLNKDYLIIACDPVLQTVTKFVSFAFAN